MIFAQINSAGLRYEVEIDVRTHFILLHGPFRAGISNMSIFNMRLTSALTS